jgi:hypothetical protein
VIVFRVHKTEQRVAVHAGDIREVLELESGGTRIETMTGVTYSDEAFESALARVEKAALPAFQDPGKTVIGAAPAPIGAPIGATWSTRLRGLQPTQDCVWFGQGVVPSWWEGRLYFASRQSAAESWWNIQSVGPWTAATRQEIRNGLREFATTPETTSLHARYWKADRRARAVEVYFRGVAEPLWLSAVGCAFVSGEIEL